jgi:hypothetical protein
MAEQHIVCEGRGGRRQPRPVVPSCIEARVSRTFAYLYAVSSAYSCSRRSWRALGADSPCVENSLSAGSPLTSSLRWS